MAERSDPHDEKISLKTRLKRGGLGWRILIGLLLTFGLAVFLHFREERVEVLELDTHAQKYVVAQVDFGFADETLTVIARENAKRDLSAIYRIDDQEISEKFSTFTTAIAKEPNWKQRLPNINFETIYDASLAVEEAMKKTRFTDELTLSKIKSMRISIGNYYAYRPPSTTQGIQLPMTYWTDLSSRVVSHSNVNAEAVNYIIQYLSSDTWQINEDAAEQQRLRQLVSNRVEVRYSPVKAGSRVIDQGEKVTQRHLAMIQGMKKAMAEQRDLWQPLTMLGSFVFALVIVTLGAVFFRIFHRDLFHSVQKLAIFATIFVVTMALAKGVEYFLLETSHPLMDVVRFPLLVPFAAILICILIDHAVALFAVLFLSVILSMTLAVEHSYFLVVNVVAGVVAVIATRGVRKRKEVFVVAGKVWLACLPVVIAFSLEKKIYWDMPLGADILSTFVFMVITAILVVGFLPILESIFRVMTDITLMEYMDPNTELLRRLSMEAPGTYQHSLVVGSLSESAAYAIGANGLFCRVVSLYHDIGKLFNPHYFTENQMGGFNIHQLLTPLESTQVIMAHVPEGEALAKKHNLPRTFIDIIREHHGTTLVYYFYSKQVEQMGGDVDAVNEKQFRYAGPKPRSKESAIIMIADSMEAASRSLDQANEEILTDLIDRVVTDKAEERQFDDCQLTFEELGIVKRTIVKNLAVSLHSRIPYPKRK